jgi:hypothetical protein
VLKRLSNTKLSIQTNETFQGVPEAENKVLEGNIEQDENIEQYSLEIPKL